MATPVAKQQGEKIGVLWPHVLVLQTSQIGVNVHHEASAGLMPTEARGNYLPEAPYLRVTKIVKPI